MIRDLEVKSYYEQLRELAMSSLTKRRFSGDILEGLSKRKGS